MGGEVSKSSGELGEQYVKDFLNDIGWVIPQANLSFLCEEPEKHNTNNAQKGRQTHGIDYLYSYDSPMALGTLVHTVISSKHNNSPYPNSPNTEFKKHITDLADTIECFENSNIIELNREGKNCIDEQIVGVLFWLSSGSSLNTSIVSKLNSIIPSQLVYDHIYVIDNDRVDFITKSIALVKNQFKGYSFNFYYIDTPNNQDDINKQYVGNKLPVEMLSSDIQIFKLQKEGHIILAIVMKDEFSDDGLKRTFGLAHRISNNLASNVYIFFPSFEHEVGDNKNKISRIKSHFKDENFINSVYVYGYDIGYRGTNIPIHTSSSQNIPNEDYNEPKVDDGKTLPYGEYLRSLISRSNITESELKKLLQQKGIYVCNPTKEHTIPILSSLLLSPREFDQLREHQKTREDKEKRATSTLKAENMPKSMNLKKALGKVILNDVDKSKFSNYSFKTPIVSFQPVTNNPNKVVVEYEIERHQKNKSWDDQVNYFKGSIIFDYNGNELQVTSQSRFTSKETQKINNQIVTYCIGELKKNNIIPKEASEEKILMKNMKNEDVLQFLLAFTNNKLLDDIEFEYMVSLNTEIDASKTLPNENTLKWMENKIKKLKFDGKKIDETELIKEKKNHQYIKCWGVLSEYKFDDMLGKGKASVKLEFNEAHGGEFEVSIEKLTYDKKLFNKKNIEEMILADIEKVKIQKYREIVNKQVK